MDKQTNKPRWYHPDVPKAVRDHLMGENHTLRHKFLTGTVISSFGLFIVWASHASAGIFGGFLEWPLHHFGYGLHGMGWLPLFSLLERKKDGKNE